jgi:membrane protein DedA with SNARE-associated domain
MDLSIFNDAEALISSYGPIAVLILLILPLMGEDIIIVPAGFLIGQGHLSPWETFICAYIGALISDAMWYFACYRWGSGLLHKKWFKRLAHPRRLLQAKHQVEKRGAWLIVTARFVPGSRTSAMIASGLLHMPIWKFALAECTCLLVTIPMQLGLGVLISRHVVGSTTTAGKILTIIGVVVALIVAAFIWNWMIQHRKTKLRAPRSKAIWLRKFRPRRLHRMARSRPMVSGAPVKFTPAQAMVGRKGR